MTLSNDPGRLAVLTQTAEGALCRIYDLRHHPPTPVLQGFLKFEMTRPGVLYLCIDARNRRRPAWINERGFRTTTMMIQTTAEVPFRVFKKVSAGPRLNPDSHPNP